MTDPSFRLRPGVRREFVRFRTPVERTSEAFLRAGVAGAYLPPIRLEVPHLTQERLSDSVPYCVSMVQAAHGWDMAPGQLRTILRTDDVYGTPGRRLNALKAWGVRAQSPRDLQLFRDGSLELSRRLAPGGSRLVFRWEERWLRFVAAALREGQPVILFVDLGRMQSGWRGLTQPHAVVLSGGDGRRAWIQDPGRQEAPVRVGLGTLMDALLPGEPLAAVLRPDAVALSLQRGNRE
jgi:hypothetical protein